MAFNQFTNLDELWPLSELEIESLDLFNCPVSSVIGYKKHVFYQVHTLTCLDGAGPGGEVELGMFLNGGERMTSLTQRTLLGYRPKRRPITRFPRYYFKPLKAVPDFESLQVLHNEISESSKGLRKLVDAAVFCSPVTSLKDYLDEAVKKIDDQNGNRLVQLCILPTNELKAKLTEEGCSVLESWVCSFTDTLAMNYSWDGEFDLNTFVLIYGQVIVLKRPNPRFALRGERQRDCRKLVSYIKFYFTLDGHYPPYLDHFIKKLLNIPEGPLMQDYKLALDTHFCFKTMLCQVEVVYLMKCAYDGLTPEKKGKFITLVDSCDISENWSEAVRGLQIFKIIIDWGQEDVLGRPQIEYNLVLNISAFFLIRNFNSHVDKNSVAGKNKLFVVDDSVRLLVPAKFGVFLADLLFKILCDPIGADMGIDAIARNTLSSPRHVQYKVKNPIASVLEVQREEDYDKLSAEFHENLSRDELLEMIASSSQRLSKYIRDSCVELGCDVPIEVLEMEGLLANLAD